MINRTGLSKQMSSDYHVIKHVRAKKFIVHREGGMHPAVISI